MSQWVRRTGIQLAVGYEEKRLGSKTWKPPYIIQPKLDGDRIRAVFDSEGEVTLYSSESQVIWAMPHIKHQLETTGLRNLELDGEAYIHGVPQAVIHGMISSQRNELHEDFEKVEFHTFDLVDEKMLQSERTTIHARLFHEELSKLKNIKYVPFSLVEEPEEIDNWLQHYTSQGLEGFILRNKDMPYKRTRSAHIMMKFKPGREDVYIIVDVHEAIDKNGKPKGTLGAFSCVSPPSIEPFRVSAGRLKHDERDALWEIREHLKGRQIRVGYQHLTAKNGVPRHGVTLEVL